MTIHFEDSQIAWVFTDTDLDHLLNDLRGEVTFDLETTGLAEYAPQSAIVTAQFTTARRTWVLPLKHPESPFQGRWKSVITRVAQTLVDNRCELIGHNIKFDLRWMYRHTRVDLTFLVIWDTMSSSHLLDENRSAKLKEVVPRTFPSIERWDEGISFSSVPADQQPLFQLGAYGARDTFWTQQLADQHRHRMFLTDDSDNPVGSDEVDDARLGRLMKWVTIPTVKTLARIEQRGIELDEEWAKSELISHEEQAQKLTDKLARLYPQVDPHNPSFAPTSHWFRDWTQAAVEAGDLVIAELTPTGKPRWNKEVLVRQARSGSDVAIDLLAQRSHMKKAEFLRSWLTEEPPGRIHCSYNSSTVVTGRLSSSGPNMQQVTKELRKAFIPRPGYVLADLDYCLEGSMRILTSDLRWVAADQIAVGEKIIGFPEDFGRGHGYRHQYEEAEVTSVKQITRPSVILVMSDGQHIKCSREHRWMRGGKSRVREWVQAGDLQPGDVIPTLTDPWDEPRSVQEIEDRAYLRGILDGEGWVNQTTVGWGQLPGEVYDEVQAVSQRLGLDWRVNSFMNNGVVQQRVSNVRDSLRILGMVRPVRLLPKARQMWEGRNTWGKSKTGAMVVEIIDAGEQPVWAIGTSSKTMVVEGLLSHNSQIELRVAAFISRSEPMIKAFQRGDDLHTLLAAKITSKDPSEVTPEERQAGKSANFGLLYGMGAVGFRMYSEAVYGVSFSRDEATVIHRAFFDMWDGMREWHARSAKVAHDTGQVKSPIGRIRRLPDITDGNEERVTAAERAAINAPVQGFASDLMQIASASIEGMIPGHTAVDRAYIVATVHDSIVVEVAADDWENITRQCIERMVAVTDVVSRLGCVLDVPLTVGATVGTRWGLNDIGEL